MVSLSGAVADVTAMPTGGLHRTAQSQPRRGPIVLATDGDSRCGTAVIAAQMIASRLDVPLTVVSVLEPTLPYTTVPEFVIPTDPEIDERRRDAQEVAVSDYFGRFAGGTTPPHVHVRFGAVAAEISRYAREVSATMIVLGSAPNRHFRHTVSGDRAAQVLHSARCPILSVPPTFAGLPHVVVAAVDFSPASVAAAQAALLTVRDGGTLVLTHVLTPLMRPASIGDTEPGKPVDDVQQLFDRVREELRPWTPPGVKVETRIVTDDAVNGILSSAEHLDADLVAVGTHGPGVVSRLLLGSVAERILHRAYRAVLVSPPPLPAEALELRRRITGVASTSRGQEWAAVLDAFTRRNAGRSVMLEVDDPESGAHVMSHGYALVGVTYEPKAHRLQIMLGNTRQPLHHVTRSVLRPDTITVSVTPDGTGEVLDIHHGRGHTIAAVADTRPAVAEI